jgi:hypothetical protein
MFSPLRISIAKWLAPDVFEKVAIIADAAENLSKNYHRTLENLDRLRDGYDLLYDKRHDAVSALVAISKLRTPRAAHGVKKACDIADKALKGERT